MQKIIKTTRRGLVSSSTGFFSALARRLTLWLSVPPAQHGSEASASESSGDGRPRRRAGAPVGSIRFDGERLGGWPGEGKIR
ncbi:MAG TPA: hypothetical protein VK195_06325 [Burkholderiaceae bacterium]|nr:hypothetical protein [Burkholderiaceae bacterium]